MCTILYTPHAAATHDSEQETLRLIALILKKIEARLDYVSQELNEIKTRREEQRQKEIALQQKLENI